MSRTMRVLRRFRSPAVAVAVSEVGRLVWRLVRDQRTPPKVRVGLVGVAAYVAAPVDLVPIWIPFVGKLDDLIVLTFGVRMLLREVPEELLTELWDGDPATLERVLGRPLAAGSVP